MTDPEFVDAAESMEENQIAIVEKRDGEHASTGATPQKKKPRQTGDLVAGESGGFEKLEILIKGLGTQMTKEIGEVKAAIQTAKSEAHQAKQVAESAKTMVEGMKVAVDEVVGSANAAKESMAKKKLESA